MPRLRGEAVEPLGGGVPPELLNRDDVVWQSVSATQAWLERHGLRIGDALLWGPANRHRSSSEAWALQAGIVMPNPFPGGRYPLDWARMRELGLPGASREAGMERLRYAGLTFGEES